MFPFTLLKTKKLLVPFLCLTFLQFSSQGLELTRQKPENKKSTWVKKISYKAYKSMATQPALAIDATALGIAFIVTGSLAGFGQGWYKVAGAISMGGLVVFIATFFSLLLRLGICHAYQTKDKRGTALKKKIILTCYVDTFLFAISLLIGLFSLVPWVERVGKKMCPKIGEIAAPNFSKKKKALHIVFAVIGVFSIPLFFFRYIFLGMKKLTKKKKKMDKKEMSSKKVKKKKKSKKLLNPLHPKKVL